MSIKPAQSQYLRISDQLAEDIAHGRLAPGERLATERDMAEHFGCTRVTLRQALQRLEAQGTLYRGHRRGWFVAPTPIRYDPTRITGFMEYVSAQGREPRTECLLAEQRPAGAWLAQRMGIGAQDLVFYLQRRRWVDARPVLLETNVLNPSWCPGLLEHRLDGSLTALLREHYGQQQARSQINLKPCLLDEGQSAELEIASGSSGLYLERVCFAQDGSIVEFDREFWRPDAVEVTLSIDR
ncbi:putative transcriptional regulator [Pseudomonas sp. M47T1]|uniref:UTRA domain-containing protein n=1 Tax=unclassified Pseudomonas TaxID=196821 RepID=UPI00026078E4|nr:UTRA domain-containing protein [Pseudomonas sp. M47T1]EIK94632.1 putative transcriptional regulator [Pseudomonas sp. M47T1]